MRGKPIAHDSCVINKEELSLRAKDLKAKLFGTAANGYEPIVAKAPTYSEDMLKAKARRQAARDAEVGRDVFEPKGNTTSLSGLQADQMK